MGKRNALSVGAGYCNGDYIVLVDSDTEIKSDAFHKLYQTITVENAGAVCGNIFVRNENQNLLTRVIAAMYWFAFHMERASQSYFGCQIVCSGALSMYKSKPFKDYVGGLLTQRSLGVKCVAGDDRHLTNQFIMNGYKSTWCENAIAWTDTPATLRGFIKQQLRWTRSFGLEVAWLIPRLAKFSKMYIFMIARSLFKYFYLLCMYIGVLCFASRYSVIDLLSSALLGAVSFVAIKGVIACLFSKKASMFIKTVGFAVLGYSIMSPILLYGIFTCRINGWLTRDAKQ